MSKSILPLFSFRSFIVSGLIFRYLIHFIFVICVREYSDFFLLHVDVQFYQHHLLKRPSFLQCIFLPPFFFYSCLLCHRLIDHKSIGLFLGFLYCSIDLYVCFCASTLLFWLLYLPSMVKCQRKTSIIWYYLYVESKKRIQMNLFIRLK